MSALGPYFRLQVKNTTGAASGATTTIKAKRWKPGSAGEADFEATEQTMLSSASISPAGFATGTAYDNDGAGTGYYGLSGLITIVNGTSAGYYEVRLQVSNDGGTTWPDNGAGIPVASIYCAASTTVKVNVSVR